MSQWLGYAGYWLFNESCKRIVQHYLSHSNKRGLFTHILTLHIFIQQSQLCNFLMSTYIWSCVTLWKWLKVTLNWCVGMTYLKILPSVNSIFLKSGLRSGSSSQQFLISMYSCLHTQAHNTQPNKVKKEEESAFSFFLFILMDPNSKCLSQCLVALLPQSPALMHHQSWGQVWRCSSHLGIGPFGSSLRDQKTDKQDKHEGMRTISPVLS